MADTLTLTPAAAKRVGWIAQRQDKPAILRLTVEGGGELNLGHFADVYTLRTGVGSDDLNPFLANDWIAIPVEAALYEDVVDAAGKPTGARRPKGRSTKGDRK